MQVIIKITKRLLLFLINIFVLMISLVIPKSEKIVVVGGWFGKRFADNSKNFYLYLNSNLNELGFNKVIWITRSKDIKDDLMKQGYTVYSTWNIISIWYHFRGKYHLIDQAPTDINSFFSVRSKRINLWHGFPLKKIGNYMEEQQFKFVSRTLRLFNKLTTRGFWADYYLLATSKFSAEILGKAFGVKKERILISGYPRNYEPIFNHSVKYLSRNEKTYHYNIDKYIIKGYKIIGYFPTFRDEKETLLFGTNDIEKISLFLDWCEDKKLKFIGKFHFAGKNDKIGKIKNHPAFINLPSKSDAYTFFDKIDILITDYSSIYFDFLLWNRPIIFFPYDLDYYRDEDRGLIFDYEEFTPGLKVYNVGDLKNLLSQDLDSIAERYEEEYRQNADCLKEKIFGDYNNMGIDHLINRIKNTDIEEEK